MLPDDIRDIVRDRYGILAAQGSSSCCTSSCCCHSAPAAQAEIAKAIGYTDDELSAVPDAANLGLGCGTPLRHADVKRGESVLDLGSGAGMDVFLAARKVGPTGAVIGVDMTPQMLQRAREAARTAGIRNVEFRLGEIEHLPVADNSVDLVVSNCVINLSPDKRQVFREAWRVLKPGGRMVVSDLVLRREISPALRNNVAAYVGCVAGAVLTEQYLCYVRDAGFQDAEIIAENCYEGGLEELSDPLRREALEAVISLTIRARKGNVAR